MSLSSDGSVVFPEQLLLTGMHFGKYVVSVVTVSSAFGFQRSQCIEQSDLELEFLVFQVLGLVCVPHSESGLFKQSCYANIIESTYAN